MLILLAFNFGKHYIEAQGSWSVSDINTKVKLQSKVMDYTLRALLNVLVYGSTCVIIMSEFIISLTDF